jgi:LEA14-like dessication related protein
LGGVSKSKVLAGEITINMADSFGHYDDEKRRILDMTKTFKLSRLEVFLWALVGAVMLTACGGSALKKPSLEVAEVRIADFDRDAVQLTVTLKVQNPNPIELSITDIQAKFFLANQEAGQIESAQAKYLLPASGSVMLPIKVNIPFKSLPDTLKKSTLALVSGGLPYKITGSITTFNGLLNVPFEKTGEIGKRR